MGVHSDLVLGGITDETFGVAVSRVGRVQRSDICSQSSQNDQEEMGNSRESDVRRGGSVSLVLSSEGIGR